MKKEEFMALGISEELAQLAEEASKKELEGYAAKAEYDSAVEAKTQLEKDIKARDKQLEDLKKSAGNNDEMQKQIAALQEENKTVKEKYEADMKELKLTTAIKLALGDSTHDAELVSGLIDRTKIILTDDGKVSGLEEQVKGLKESKGFLFKESTTPTAGGDIKGNKPGYKPKAGDTSEGSWAKSVAEEMNKEGSTNPYASAWGIK